MSAFGLFFLHLFISKLKLADKTTAPHFLNFQDNDFFVS